MTPSTQSDRSARWFFCTWCMCICFSLATNNAEAGGGPENAVVVVNGRSTVSRRIANHYVHLRGIPSTNVIVLNDAPVDDIMTVDEFREKILRPVLSTIVARKLDRQIDYVIYSADFPTAIKLDTDIAELDRRLPEIYTPFGSLNGLTFLHSLTMGKNAAYMQMQINHYFQATSDEASASPFFGPPGEPFNAAVEQFEAGEFEDALADFEAFDDENPGYAGVSMWIARCLAQLERDDEARSAIQESIDRGWSYPDDTQLDPAFLRYRNQDWFADLFALMAPVPRGSRPTRAFRAAQGWAPRGLPVQGNPLARKYLLSTVLAFTKNGYMTEDEAIEMLERSVHADFSSPRGTFYFAETDDIRSKTRQPAFENAMLDLARLGHRAEIFNEPLIKNRRDVLGLMIGTPRFDWPDSGNEMVPGAISENLTSFGGVLQSVDRGQTRLTEFLRGGAAGSSGTVTEPFAIQNKFPHPHLQVHYARGASLAEAFYQSVQGPYQLLIMGDALCQPFAKPPRFSVEGWTDGVLKEISGMSSLMPSASNVEEIDHFDVYLNGKQVGRLEVENPLEFDSSSIPDGYHELRLVAIGNSPIETQSRSVFPLLINNNDQNTQLTFETLENIGLNDSVEGTLTSKGASKIALIHDAEIVAEIEGETGSFSVSARKLGRGPVRLQAIGIVDGQPISSIPKWLDIGE